MAKILLDGYTSIPATRQEVGKTYRWWLHNTECKAENALSVRLDSKPDCAVRDMSEDDAYVGSVLDSGGKPTGQTLTLKRNAAYPYFLVSRVAGRKEGTTTSTRLSILKKNDG